MYIKESLKKVPIILVKMHIQATCCSVSVLNQFPSDRNNFFPSEILMKIHFTLQQQIRFEEKLVIEG